MSVTLRAYAKINITLDVTGKRGDGYHTVCMVMQPVSLFDEITVSEKPGGGIDVATNLGYLPTDRRNSAYKAAELFFAYTGYGGGVRIKIGKNIPVAAGLAGGSTDAAAVLRGLDVLTGAGLTEKELWALALRVGADVPFCLFGRTALAEGIGEILTELPPMPRCHVLLCKPPVSISTEKAYRQLDETHIVRRPDTQGVIAALQSCDLHGVARRMYNVMEEQARSAYKSIGEIKKTMIEQGALGAVMSGSGPTVFGLYDEGDRAEQTRVLLAAQYTDTFLCTNTTDRVGNE